MGAAEIEGLAYRRTSSCIPTPLLGHTTRNAPPFARMGSCMEHGKTGIGILSKQASMAGYLHGPSRGGGLMKVSGLSRQVTADMPEEQLLGERGFDVWREERPTSGSVKHGGFDGLAPTIDGPEFGGQMRACL